MGGEVGRAPSLVEDAERRRTVASRPGPPARVAGVWQNAPPRVEMTSVVSASGRWYTPAPSRPPERVRMPVASPRGTPIPFPRSPSGTNIPYLEGRPHAAGPEARPPGAPPSRRQPPRAQRGEDAGPRATSIALGRAEGDGPVAVTDALSALDKAAEQGHHPSEQRRPPQGPAHDEGQRGAPARWRRHRSGAAQAQDDGEQDGAAQEGAAAKASKAAAAKATDRPRTAAGKAKVAVTRAQRESAAARRRKQSDTGEPKEG